MHAWLCLHLQEGGALPQELQSPVEAAQAAQQEGELQAQAAQEAQPEAEQQTQAALATKEESEARLHASAHTEAADTEAPQKLEAASQEAVHHEEEEEEEEAAQTQQGQAGDVGSLQQSIAVLQDQVGTWQRAGEGERGLLLS